MYRGKGNSNQGRQRSGHIVRAAIIARALKQRIAEGETVDLADYHHGDAKLKAALIEEMERDG